MFVVEEREAESVEGIIEAGNQSAVDELDVELGGMGGMLVRREELVVEVEGGDARPEGPPFLGDEGGFNGV